MCTRVPSTLAWCTRPNKGRAAKFNSTSIRNTANRSNFSYLSIATESACPSLTFCKGAVMKRLFGSLVTAFALILMSSYMWTHRERVATAVAVSEAPVVTQGTPTDQTYDEVKEAQKAVTLSGPLANYMARQKPS